MTMKAASRKTSAGTRYRRRKPGARRKPMAGLLEPGASVVHTIEPPMRPNEQPVILASNSQDVLMHDIQANRVTVINRANRAAGYVLWIVPSVLVRAAMVPWGRVIGDLGRAVRDTGILAQIKQLFGGTGIIPGG